MVFVVPPVPRPVLRGILLATLVTALALAGCSGKDPPAIDDAAAEAGMSIVGLVQNETFVPVPGALVSLRLTEHVVTTDAGGAFAFRDLPLSPYLVDVVAAGFANATLTADPLQNVSLSFVLYKPAVGIPEPVTVHFTGYFECAFEALIIPGSCDFFLEGTGQDIVEDLNTFQAGLGPNWSTVVIDVDFDAHAGLDGLRVTLRAKSDADQLGTYEDYGQFHGPESFSFRVEPDVILPEGDRPVPSNTTSFEIAVYPHGHGWHALCTAPVPEPAWPPSGSCPLGVGVARDVQFDLYVTVFFVEPAPEGFTLLA